MEVEINIEEPEGNYEYLAKIPIVDDTITYNEFFNNYMLKNQACLIKNVGTNWECSQLWIQNRRPNFSYLKDKYGKCNVTIYDCNEKYYNSQKTTSCSFEHYLDYWETYRLQGYPENMPVKYLKDWHLKNQFPLDNFYQVPVYFTSDWLNEYFVENSLDDYRFVYMGPKGTWTPFHADVFRSYSWSTNICGRKKWLILRPGKEQQLKDSLGNLPYDISNFNSTSKFEIIQEAGDAFFVPSGWYHQVLNLDDTISLNHNWINGCNVGFMFNSMIKELNDVKNEIKDCSDMDNFLEHCQIMLKASFGIDFAQFLDFLKHIADKRINLIQNNEPIEVKEGWNLGKNHAEFDLKKILQVLEDFQNQPDLIHIKLLQPIQLLLNTVKKILYN